MNPHHAVDLHPFIRAVIGDRRSEEIFASVEVPTLPAGPEGHITGAQLAMALAMLLFEDVCNRVPAARAYVADLRRAGRRLVLDHGALRTVAAACGELPPGRAAFARFLEPLGYRLAATYPLPKLAMTGFAYAHAEFPDEIPQYFVSELDPGNFSPEFQAAVGRVVGTSRDPLPASSIEILSRLAEQGAVPFEAATKLLPDLVSCFDRQHDHVSVADYEQLAAESDEMAWISTEGQAFNHATDRVDDVGATADEQRRLGRPIKESLEHSASGRVIQTALRAATVERLMVDENGEIVIREVPGSFHEFITRKRDESGALDLTFDSSNAQGIFVMTRRGESR